jgi:hypothetical protein
LLDFYESGSFDGNDKALVSCIDPNEMKRWGNSVSFENTKAQFVAFDEFLNEYNFENKRFDFISLMRRDLIGIYSQIDLDLHGN